MLWLFTLSLALHARGAPTPLEAAIAERAMRVEEFRYIRGVAEELGIRIWLFGGTAAGFGHYVKWDLDREAGDTTYVPSRFDYDYTNIYRSTQDLDLAVDGPPESAPILEARLTKRYAYVTGSKSAWEVRLLKEKLGDKEPILGPDFQNQHTDSNSTGMIELSVPPAGESVVRDALAWKRTRRPFLDDIREGKLHFYHSPSHGTTSRAAWGLNPPILSAIRYLTKAFQYELKVEAQDLERVRAIVRDFDPKRDLKEPYVRTWIERNGIKLYQHAVSLEYARKVLDDLKLREKLMDLRMDARKIGTLAWWLIFHLALEKIDRMHRRSFLKELRVRVSPSRVAQFVNRVPGDRGVEYQQLLSDLEAKEGCPQMLVLWRETLLPAEEPPKAE